MTKSLLWSRFVPGSFEIKRDATGAVISSTATVSGFDGVVASVTTNYDTNTGLPIVGTAPGVNASTATVSGLNTITKVLLKDHLGSMVAEITIVGTGASPTVLATNGLTVHGFGPWGNARNAANPLNADNRGFTGHEHLTDLGIIHMNGRLYDPVMGRFLQADPIIQAPQNAQSHNRYSYVLNNPLSFTDPSGFSAWTKWRSQVVAAVAWVATMFLSGGQVQIANAVANAVRAGMDAHSSGSNVWRAIGASLVASTLNAYGVPSTITAGVETALNGGNRRQIAASMVGAEIGALFGGMGNGFVGAAAGGCASALVNRSSCWAGARDGMIAAGIGIARQAAYAYVTSGSGANKAENARSGTANYKDSDLAEAERKLAGKNVEFYMYDDRAKLVILSTTDPNYRMAIEDEGSANTLTVHAHGDPSHIAQLSGAQLGAYVHSRGMLRDGWDLALDACRTGRENVAADMAEVLGRNVTAPTQYTWSIPGISRWTFPKLLPAPYPSHWGNWPVTSVPGRWITYGPDRQSHGWSFTR